MASLTTTTRVDSKLQTRAPRCRQPLRVRATQSPEVKRPERVVEPPKRLFSDAAPVASTAAPSASAAAHAEPLSTVGGVTIEYQRQRAKEMTKYFRELKLNEQMVKSQVFGWTRSNEINNGRWVMFGLLVGMLTEYATGVDFPDQIKLMLSYLGIVDVE